MQDCPADVVLVDLRRIISDQPDFAEASRSMLRGDVFVRAVVDTVARAWQAVREDHVSAEPTISALVLLSLLADVQPLPAALAPDQAVAPRLAQVITEHLVAGQAGACSEDVQTASAGEPEGRLRSDSPAYTL